MRRIPYGLFALCLFSLTVSTALAQTQRPEADARIQEAARRFAEQVGAYVPYAQAYDAALRGYTQVGQPTPASTVDPSLRPEVLPQRSVLARSGLAGQNAAVPMPPQREARPDVVVPARAATNVMQSRTAPDDPQPRFIRHCACSQTE